MWASSAPSPSVPGCTAPRRWRRSAGSPPRPVATRSSHWRRRSPTGRAEHPGRRAPPGTLRADLVDIVERLARVPGVRDLAMTTNGILLPRLAQRLAAAGLRRVNIHVDSLDPVRLARLMRWGTVEEIWAGIEAAEAAGLW